MVFWWQCEPQPIDDIRVWETSNESFMLFSRKWIVKVYTRSERVREEIESDEHLFSGNHNISYQLGKMF